MYQAKFDGHVQAELTQTSPTVVLHGIVSEHPDTVIVVVVVVAFYKDNISSIEIIKKIKFYFF